MSDDEESDYNTVTHTRSGRGVKLLYSKSKVSAGLMTASVNHWSSNTPLPIGVHTSDAVLEG